MQTTLLKLCTLLQTYQDKTCCSNLVGWGHTSWQKSLRCPYSISHLQLLLSTSTTVPCSSSWLQSVVGWLSQWPGITWSHTTHHQHVGYGVQHDQYDLQVHHMLQEWVKHIKHCHSKQLCYSVVCCTGMMHKQWYLTRLIYQQPLLKHY